MLILKKGRNIIIDHPQNFCNMEELLSKINFNACMISIVFFSIVSNSKSSSLVHTGILLTHVFDQKCQPSLNM